MSNTVPAKKITRKGAGRTLGTTSFVLVTLDDLKKLTPPNPDFKWQVRRIQVEQLGGKNFVTGKIGELVESTQGLSVETAPEAKETEF